ncbi:MAG: lycopene beta-cyclase CrtY [Spirochaetaceae bacterium]|nr:lycopene beta-cyclase CrtY [Spirochaetaceae bacterium]
MAAIVTDVDLALCGGGLQSGLIVAAVCGSGSAGTVTLAERERIGGNHTWCFHAGDLSPAMRRHVESFVAYRWSSYEVRFPGYRRVLETPYAMISSERLRSETLRMLADRGGSTASEHVPAEVDGAGSVRLADGRTLAARTVIDARGAGDPAVPCGWQKFYGEELTLRREHGLSRPIVMDATVPQRDGYRFMYVLPLTPERALVEDTSFSDGPELDEDERRRRIAEWLREHGWEALRVERSERGVLPMPMAEAPEDPVPRRSPPAGPAVLPGGYRGGWFHPGTGYSLPLAAELAELIAAPPADDLAAAVAAAASERRRRARFCHRLNRLLFRWYPPEARRGIFERFYRLPEATIARYYAMRLRPVDKARILGGRPPAGLSIPARHGGRLTQAAGNG